MTELNKLYVKSDSLHKEKDSLYIKEININKEEIKKLKSSRKRILVGSSVGGIILIILGILL